MVFYIIHVTLNFQMVRYRFLYILIALLLCPLNASQLSNEALDTLPVFNTLDPLSPTSHFILNLDASVDESLSHPIFLDKTTQTITVLSKDNDFSSDLQLFQSFREEYKLFWTLFNLMIITHIAWFD